jgi:hypothetical protein
VTVVGRWVPPPSPCPPSSCPGRPALVLVPLSSWFPRRPRCLVVPVLVVPVVLVPVVPVPVPVPVVVVVVVLLVVSSSSRRRPSFSLPGRPWVVVLFLVFRSSWSVAPTVHPASSGSQRWGWVLGRFVVVVLSWSWFLVPVPVRCPLIPVVPRRPLPWLSSLPSPGSSSSTRDPPCEQGLAAVGGVRGGSSSSLSIVLIST